MKDLVIAQKYFDWFHQVKDLVIAQKYFDSYFSHTSIEDNLDEALLTAMGADYRDVDTWPCGDMVYDHYDLSFELWGAKPGWTPTEAQLQAAWDLGFYRCWICYRDNTERAAARGYPLGAPRQGTRGAENDNKIELKRTKALLDAANAKIAELEEHHEN